MKKCNSYRLFMQHPRKRVCQPAAILHRDPVGEPESWANPSASLLTSTSASPLASPLARGHACSAYSLHQNRPKNTAFAMENLSLKQVLLQDLYQPATSESDARVLPTATCPKGFTFTTKKPRAE